MMVALDNMNGCGTQLVDDFQRAIDESP